MKKIWISIGGKEFREFTLERKKYIAGRERTLDFYKILVDSLSVQTFKPQVLIYN